MRIFLSTGEASGDAYAAALLREMRSLSEGQSLKFEGLGGPRLAAEGARLIRDSSHWGAISIVQALKVLPKVYLGYYAVKRALGRGEPGLFIPIDFGYANIRLARHAKNRGWKVLYFVPPGSWRRDRQGKDLPSFTDAIVTPFEWSAEILNRMGAKAYWFGHPIKQLLKQRAAGADESARTGLAILPGSRRHEIEENLPVIAKALHGWTAGSVEFALPPSADMTWIKTLWAKHGGPAASFTQADTYGVLSKARAAVVCSGTATLEAALCGCPIVVIYRASKSMEIEAALIRFKRPKYVSLPNILLQETVVPELIQESATPSSVRSHVDALIEDGPARDAQLMAFKHLDQILGGEDAITRTAKLAMELGRR